MKNVKKCPAGGNTTFISKRSIKGRQMAKAALFQHDRGSSGLLMKKMKSCIRKKNTHTCENYYSVDLIKRGTGFIIWAALLIKH
ncbi:hypothetical protein XENTR_v10020905 [Xenopus tropicalis]|nr:hypothetical protein XENTR_v10020905 [Xenopus tropicalis]